MFHEYYQMSLCFEGKKCLSGGFIILDTNVCIYNLVCGGGVVTPATRRLLDRSHTPAWHISH